MGLPSIKFNAVTGDKYEPVELSPMLGLTSWHVYMNGYYLGSFNKMLNGWHFYGSAKSEAELTTTDREILLDLIFDYLAKLEA